MNYTVQYLQSEGAAQNFEISALVNCMVQDAIKLGASDLHIEPWEKAIAVRARVNGVLAEVAHLPLELMDKISVRFKVMANLVTYQAGMPQDGTAVGGAGTGRRAVAHFDFPNDPRRENRRPAVRPARPAV